MQFTLEFSGREFVSFDGVLAKDKKKLSGSMALLGGRLTLVDLYPTKLKKLDDPFELARETLTQIDSGPQVFEAAFEVLAKAGAKKVPADDVRAILDRVNKAAAGYGPRWEREVTLRLAESLAGQDGLGEVAVAQAKRAERLLTDDDDAATRMKVLEAVSKALTKAGKADEAKPYARATSPSSKPATTPSTPRRCRSSPRRSRAARPRPIARCSSKSSPGPSARRASRSISRSTG